MKKAFFTFALLTALCCAGAAQAAAIKTTPQQNRMKDCAAQYRQNKISKSQYRIFMAQCLKNNDLGKSSATGATKKK